MRKRADDDDIGRNGNDGGVGNDVSNGMMMMKICSYGVELVTWLVWLNGGMFCCVQEALSRTFSHSE